MFPSEAEISATRNGLPKPDLESVVRNGVGKTLLYQEARTPMILRWLKPLLEPSSLNLDILESVNQRRANTRARGECVLFNRSVWIFNVSAWAVRYREAF